MSNNHWQKDKRPGVDDLVLLNNVSETAICENLKKRFMDDWIFTYIGPVLISVNPFKEMKYFTSKEVDMYQGAATYENPPHVYALADNMYRNMTIDSENQCVIISGESGAGKTVAAKFIMDYISKISGGGERATHVKEVVKHSNPLLEAFGNAKTVRNNNSSRFGKYVEILFSSGQPTGGMISNFLLEKSRVVSQNAGERNFHVFYQLCEGADESIRTNYGIAEFDNYNYLASTDPHVDGTDDNEDWMEVLQAMDAMGFDGTEQGEIISAVAAILHLGNISFVEAGNEVAKPEDEAALDFPAHLLQVEKSVLCTKLTSRVMAARNERIDVTLNVEQAEATRDALAKAIYFRLFDYLVTRVNQSMKNDSKQKMLSIGILDIYGFEIFQKNGFEQFCINFVNEKLQQIFIELTMKAEQEEYAQEGIKWKEIDYFNNKVVCDLIEGEGRQIGIFNVLDDVCATMSAVKGDNADRDLQGKLGGAFAQNKHFQGGGRGFQVHHYAGVVNYDIDGFCDKNKDVLFVDLIEMVQGSRNTFIKTLFAGDKVDQGGGPGKRPTTAGKKIKTQANELVKKLMLCVPHYVRTIKPNETKRPLDWENKRVMHQIEYLGLKENVRVRRAGFAYRRPFDKFLKRYEILTPETSPRTGKFKPSQILDAVTHILRSVEMDPNQYQMGRSKLFIKDPASLFLLEEVRERKFDHHARVIQKAFRKYFSRQKLLRQREAAADIFFKKKQRRKHSVNRNFYSDYIGMDDKPELRALVGKREKIEFAQTVNEYNRSFKAEKRDLVLTGKALFLLGREKVKSGPNKGQMVPMVTRGHGIDFDKIQKVYLSPKQDDYMVIYISDTYAACLEVPLKTELVTTLSKKYKERVNKDLKIMFDDKIEFVTKKGKIGSDKRVITFLRGTGDQAVLKVSGIITKDASVSIGEGLPNDTRPKAIQVAPSKARPGNQGRQASRGRGGTSTRGGMGRGRGFAHRPAPGPPPPVEDDTYDSLEDGEEEEDDTYDEVTSPPFAVPSRGGSRGSAIGRGGGGRGGAGGARGGLGSIIGARGGGRGGGGGGIPGPPRGPMPANQPSFKANRARNRAASGRGRPPQAADPSVFAVPSAGVSGDVRASISMSARPQPGGGRPKPKPRTQKPALPKVKVLYDYEAQDLDELTIKEGELVELVKEDESGWWTGKVGGKEGFFPGAYVEKV